MTRPDRPETGAPRPLAWLLGSWFLLTVAISWVAAANFVLVKPERLRDSAAVFAAIPEGEPRHQALRYVASELNRSFFATYGSTQIVLGALSLLLAWSLRRQRTLLVLVLLCFLSTLWFRLVLVPEIVDLGREIDFMPREPKPAPVARFDGLHRQAVVVEVAKLVALGLASALVLLPRRSSVK